MTLGLGVGFYKLAGDAGAPTLVKTNNPQSMNFNGVDDSVRANNIADEINSTRANFSASAWINIDTTSATGTIFNARAEGDANNQFNMIYHNGTEELRCTMKAGGTLQQPSYAVGAGEAAEAAFENDGNWHHVAMTVDETADKIILYVDGTARDTHGSLGDFDATISVCSIGQNTADNAFFKGEIDEVAFWSTTLTSTHITTLYNSGAQSGEKALDLASGSHVPIPFAWYRFNEPSGTVAINTVDNTQNGTYINAPTISTSTP
jgi:hypothetical protein